MRLSTLLTLVLCILALSPTRSYGLDETEVGSIDFDKDVQPILTKYCAGCHNDEDPESDFSVSSAKSLAAGMPEKQVLDASSPEKSLLLRLILGTAEPKMPPEEEPQPTSEEIESIRAWLAAGANLDSHSQGAMNRLSAPDVPSLPPASASERYVSAALYSHDAYIEGQFGTVTAYSDADRSQNIWSNSSFPGKVNALRYSQQHNAILVASGISGVGGEAQILDARSGETIQRFLGHDDSLYCVALSPDGKLLATGSYDRKILLWDAKSGQVVRELSGHNGAIYDLDFDPSGTILATASADQTVKLWSTSTGERLDTLGQPEGELRCVRFSPDGRFLFAGGSDRQVRKWRVVSREKPGINPMLVARYAHESDIVNLTFADSDTLITISTDMIAKAWDIERLQPLGSLAKLDEMPVAVCLKNAESPQEAPNSGGRSRFAGFVVDLRGSMTQLNFSTLSKTEKGSPTASTDADLFTNAGSNGKMHEIKSATAVEPQPESEPNNVVGQANQVSVPCTIHGTLAGQDSNSDPQFGDVDLFSFDAVAGETWIIEADARGKDSKVDTLLDVLDAQGQPVIQTRLQALRESYFTFRGKDSSTSDDYRLHKWEDMELDEYLYSGGEVNRLWLYPRGPDSGFKVYPGYGKRHTFFGTTAVSHALGDVAYVVRELADGEAALPNGLPTFPIYYENDDDSRRRKGKDSYLRFTAPESGRYHVRVRDARGFADPSFQYELSVRQPKPDFQLAVKNQDLKMPLGSGREWEIEATRLDGLDGPITVTIEDLPEGFLATNPLIIEAGQRTARGTIYATGAVAVPMPVMQEEDSEVEPEKSTEAIAKADSKDKAGNKSTKNMPKETLPQFTLSLTASAMTPEGEIRREMEKSIQIWIEDKPELRLVLVDAVDKTIELDELTIRPGQTIAARVLVDRQGLTSRISFGKDDSGRNLPHGAFVDNIGLNGLLIPEGQTEREFFITAAPKVNPGRRQFHLRSETSGNPTSKPIWLHVLP